MKQEMGCWLTGTDTDTDTGSVSDTKLLLNYCLAVGCCLNNFMVSA